MECRDDGFRFVGASMPQPLLSLSSTAGTLGLHKDLSPQTRRQLIFLPSHLHSYLAIQLLPILLMGNSSSRAPSAAYISNPGPLKGVDDRSADGVHRRATAHASSHASASGTHRRTRSAIAHSDRTGSQAPPPPPPSYQEALRAPVNSPTADNNVNSNLLSVPAPQVHQRSRSQDATRSRNPFRQRPTSYNGAVARSSVDRDLPPTPATSGSGSEASRSAGVDVAPRWTSEEERLAYLRRPMRQESYENALEVLRKYNTVIVVDDSASMTKNNRWSEVGHLSLLISQFKPN